jgi:hypothetical protein
MDKETLLCYCIASVILIFGTGACRNEAHTAENVWTAIDSHMGQSRCGAAMGEQLSWSMPLVVECFSNRVLQTATTEVVEGKRSFQRRGNKQELIFYRGSGLISNYGSQLADPIIELGGRIKDFFVSKKNRNTNKVCSRRRNIIIQCNNSDSSNISSDRENSSGTTATTTTSESSSSGSNSSSSSSGSSSSSSNLVDNSDNLALEPTSDLVANFVRDCPPEVLRQFITAEAKKLEFQPLLSC